MKAWLVQDKWDCYGSEIVFAETRGKARSLALATDCCSETNFLDVAVRRQPNADKYYKEGKWHLDWDNPKDRIALVKDCGFVCDYEYLEWEDCEECSAKQYCDRYAERVCAPQNDEVRE